MFIEKRLYALLVCCLPWVGASQMVAPIFDNTFGYQLPSPSGIAVWWCEATYKVGRQRALPAETSATVNIEAARNEYEPFQIVLRPDIPLSNLVVTVSDFVRQGGGPAARIAATNVEICTVEYVPVTEPSDNSGASGMADRWCADGRGHNSVDTNQPFWFTVYVPKDAPAGHYQAADVRAAGRPTFAATVQLRVFNFALPDVTHTRTAYGLNYDFTWHGLTSVEEKLVWDLYLQNFRQHRVSPYMPQALDQIKAAARLRYGRIHP